MLADIWNSAHGLPAPIVNVEGGAPALVGDKATLARAMQHAIAASRRTTAEPPPALPAAQPAPPGPHAADTYRAEMAAALGQAARYPALMGYLAARHAGAAEIVAAVAEADRCRAMIASARKIWGDAVKCDAPESYVIAGTAAGLGPSIVETLAAKAAETPVCGWHGVMGGGDAAGGSIDSQRIWNQVINRRNAANGLKPAGGETR